MRGAIQVKNSIQPYCICSEMAYFGEKLEGKLIDVGASSLTGFGDMFESIKKLQGGKADVRSDHKVLLQVAILSEGEVMVGIMAARNVQKLKTFSELPANWNENGALPFSNALIKRCRHIISILDVQPEIFPTGANSIQMEYEKENGEYLEFNIYDDRIDIYRVDSDGSEDEYSIGIQEENMLKKLVGEFYAGNQ